MTVTSLAAPLLLPQNLYFQMKSIPSFRPVPPVAGFRFVALLGAILGLWLTAAHAQLSTLPGLTFGANNTFSYDDPDDPGVPVTGFLRIPGTVRGHAIIICHGKGGSASNFNSLHAPNFLAEGYVCIIPELTHTGSGSPNGGVDEGYSPENSRRGRACLKILQATPGVDMTRVAMFGHSMGAYFIGGFAGEDPAPYAPLRAVVEGSGGAQGTGGSSTNSVPSAAEVAGITAPVMMFHGTGDPSYPLSVNLQASLAAHSVPNRLLLYQGVPHGIFDTNQKRLEAYVISRAWFTQSGVLSFPGNTAPSIVAPATVTVTAGVPSAPIAIMVNDTETAAGSLTVQAYSLDTDVAGSAQPPVTAYSGLLQNSQIAIGGSGQNRTLTLTPSEGKSGTLEIAIVVTDSTAGNGQLSAFTILSVTITSGAPPPFTFGSSQGGTSLTGQNGTPLSITLTASGAAAPVSWTQTAGALPAGVALGSNGVLSGMPTQSGTFNFTVQATDANSVSATQAYTLTLAGAPGSVNHRPTISWMPDLRVAPGAAVPQQSFTIGDDQTPAGSLVLTRGSTNQTLLPIGGIVIGGSGASRTLTLTPATGQTGRATVSITVTDAGGKSSVSAFTLNVASPVAGNTPPVIQGVANEMIVSGGSYGPLTLVVKDTESAENTLTLTSSSTNSTLLPSGSIVFGPSNPAQQNWGRTVTVTPAPGQTGRAVVTLNVSDGPNTTATAFVLDVVSGNTAPSITNLATYQAADIGTAPQPVSFKLNDAETAATGMLVTASSSNAALVPNSGIMLGGTDENRTVTLTPTPGQRGAATITLAVSDGDIIRRAQFLYVVTDPSAPSEQFAKSRGVFLLDSVGALNYTTTFGLGVSLRDGNMTNLATKTHVDGYTLRVSWDEVEGGLGQYDFFVIQNALNKLPADKKLSIIVVPGEPAYIAATAGVTTWADGSTTRAVPWDPFLRARRHALVEAMASFLADGAPLRTNPRLVVLDPYLPGGTTGIRDPNTASLSALPGYTRQKLLETVQDDLRLFQDSFPGKRVQVGFFPVNDNENASYGGKSSATWLREQLLAEFNGVIRPRIGFFMELLAAKRSGPNVDPYSATPITSFASPMFAARDEAWGSFQMLGSWTNPFNDGHVNMTLNGSPTDAMEWGYNTYNSEYTEVYVGDVNNAAFRPMLQAWHDFLGSRPVVGNAPVISPIANQSIPADSSAGPLAFTVSDAETAAAGLSITGSSSNQNLLPDTNIVFGGADNARTVTVTPVAGQSGIATVTLTVSDGVSSTQTSFVLEVLNSPPVANAQTVGLLEDGGAVPVTLSGSDPENTPLIYTVLSLPAKGVLSGTAPNLSYTPAANANGSDSFTFKVSDGSLDSPASVVSLDIAPVNDVPSFADGGNQTVAEDAGPQTVTGWAAAISAGPPNESGQAASFIVGNDNSALFSTQPAVSPAGTLTFTPAADASGSANVTVRLLDSGGTANGGADTSAAHAFTITVTPVTDVPNGLTATPVSSTEIDVNWSTVPEAAAYKLQSKTGSTDFSTIYTGAAALFAHTGLTPETTYTYQVRAQSIAGDSDWSVPATATTLPPPTTILVRHAPTLNGQVDGRVQVLLGENITLNGGASISGDLLVPGTPTIKVNGNGTYAGIVDGSGSASPANYQITLNGGSSVGVIKRHTEPVSMPVVNAPPAPTGTVNVTLNNSSQSVSDWAALRNLTLNGNVGAVSVPAGTYGNFTANGSSSFVLGVPGATQPAVYNLQALTLNGSSQIQVVGPVVLILGGQLNANGSAGNAAHPEWLVLKVTSGGVTLNGNVSIYARVTAPAGTVTVNGNSRLVGSIASDRVTINGSGLVQQATP